jgi:hypothetical protein
VTWGTAVIFSRQIVFPPEAAPEYFFYIVDIETDDREKIYFVRQDKPIEEPVLRKVRLDEQSGTACSPAGDIIPNDH